MIIALLILMVIMGSLLAFGFYRGWFSLVSLDCQDKSCATLSVNKSKIKSDKNQVIEQVHDIGQEAVDKIAPSKD